MSDITETTVEAAALDWLRKLGYTVLYGPDIAPGAPAAERSSYADVVLMGRLTAALRRLNPDLPTAALNEALRKLTQADAGSLLLRNRRTHRMLTEGVEVDYRAADSTIKSGRVIVLDFAQPENNDFLAVNQFTVIEGKERRPDVVVFINGLPLAVIELKNAADEKATIWSAFQQLQTYKHQIPALFATNALLVISDGSQARLGSLTADRERFMPWRTVSGQDLAPATMNQLQVLLEGVFQKDRLLDLLRFFIVFEDDGPQIIKKIAGYHQFHAVRTAVWETVRAAGQGGDRRGGVVWHTQGSGKSLTMAFYSGRVVLDPAMQNPTLVVLTDRNDLDDQLFATFSRCADLLRQTPLQAQSRAHLQSLLRVASGGVIFATVQKFSLDERGAAFPQLSDRRNIIVIADEAHRSQYDFIDGFARHIRDALPNATFIGFTGTPIEQADRSTRNIFGDYISVYDIQRAVEDGNTVPIYYEGRLAKLALKEEERPHIDPHFEEVTEGAEETVREQVKRKWAQLEAMVGTPQRLAMMAQDMVDHFEMRLAAMEGKGMIVTMSRRIAVDLYDEIIKIRPDWHSEDDSAGAVKVVMTGSASDPLSWQPHIRAKSGRDALAKRLKDPADPLKLVIVRDMWLTGFDAPSLHTMYIDKPMHGHSLMQAIARVNRVYRDKPGGLIVDYLGIADQLKQALRDYTQSGGQGEAVLDQSDAVRLMLEKYDICVSLFHGFDYTAFYNGQPGEQLSLLAPAQEHILAQTEGRSRFITACLALSRAFALAVAHDETRRIRDDVAFFQAVRAVQVKTETSNQKSPDEMHYAVRQIVSQAITSDRVIDIFAAAGLERPDMSILSDEFLAEVRNMPYKNLAIETLRKLLNDEIKIRSRSNLIQSQLFSEMLAQALRAYQNRSLETAEILHQLITLAEEMRAAGERGEKLGLAEDELAFYDALEVNDSAVKILGDDVLRTIAHDLAQQVRANATIDWTLKESVRANLRRLIKRTLRKYGYPPDRHNQAIQAIMMQAEALAAQWS